jgi:hypothetical protein
MTCSNANGTRKKKKLGFAENSAEWTICIFEKKKVLKLDLHVLTYTFHSFRTHLRPSASASTYLPTQVALHSPSSAAAVAVAAAASAADHHFHNDHCVIASAALDVHPSKNCCGVHVTQTVSIRWFIVMIAFVGICCSIVGTALGALKASGREHLTVSLLMIGEREMRMNGD